MVLGFCTYCTLYYSLCRNFCDNPSVNSTGNPDKVVRAVQSFIQDLVESTFNNSSKNATTPSLVDTFFPPCDFILASVPASISTKELFKRFMTTYKAFVKVLE